jgi:serine/threonine protein kinase
MDLSDPVLDHLRQVAGRPDLTGTRFELEREAGRGGAGVVYAALDRELGRRVALKVLDAGLPQAALAEEARLIASLDHPAIVPIYEAGTLPDGRSYYAMKFVDGKRLDDYLDAQKSLPERLRIVERVGEALAFAHTKGVIHRDLKPQNVMVGAFGEVYVMDWGVEGVAGTPQFRAPEQAVPGKLDPRSDVYALGALLQFLLPPKAPPALRAIAAKAMSPEPRLRYAGVPAFLTDLDNFQNLSAVDAFPESPLQKSWRFVLRNQVLLLLLAAYTAVRIFLFFLRRI